MVASPPSSVVKMAKLAKDYWLKNELDDEFEDEVEEVESPQVSPFQGASNNQAHSSNSEAIMANAMNKQVDLSAQIVQMMDDSNRFSSGGIAKTQPWTSRLLLRHQLFYKFAGALNPTTGQAESNMEFKTFLESKKEQSIPTIIHHVVYQRNGTQMIDNAMAVMLYGLNFGVTTRSNIPQGLSVFFSVPSPMSGENETFSIEEYSLLEKSQKLSVAQIKSLTTPTIQVPLTDFTLRETIKNHLKLLDFIFTKESMVYKNLEQLSDVLKACQREVKVMSVANKMFKASVLQKIDQKFQAFFKSCSTAWKIEEVKFHHIDFSKEVSMIESVEQFNVVVPDMIKDLVNAAKNLNLDGEAVATAGKPAAKTPDKQITPAPKRPSPNPPDADQDPKESRAAKRAKRNAGNETKNPSPVNEWLAKADEDYKEVFFKHINSAPKVQGRTLCAMYHIQGKCGFGERCARKASHTVLERAAAAEMSKWIKKCRENAKQDADDEEA